MFSSTGRKKGFLDSITASVSKVFENTVVPEKVITLPPSSREGADNDSSREGADYESSGARALWRPRKCVLPVASPMTLHSLQLGPTGSLRSLVELM